ncbi:MAG: hypothetical protein QOH06_5423 [Acidobacteriota bacterium]|jgi:hypothetical protein|nr:hypothetical protein [Acidobacteriota bacterium]
MEWLSLLAAEAAKAHQTLASANSSGGKNKSMAMCGAIAVVQHNAEVKAWGETSNFKEGTHVEMDLIKKLRDWCGPSLSLSASSTVYLYVYDSPCEPCAETLRPLPDEWRKKSTGNKEVKWELGFSVYYTVQDNESPLRTGRFANNFAAEACYRKQLANWKFKKVNVAASLKDVKKASGSTNLAAAVPASPAAAYSSSAAALGLTAEQLERIFAQAQSNKP